MSDRQISSLNIRRPFRKEDTMKILFSDEKLLGIDGICNSQNDGIWVVNHVEANIKGGIRQIRKFLQKIMVWLGACSKELSPSVIFENGTVDYNRYINKVLLVALKYENSILGNDWIFQQDSPKPHFHEKTQEWCGQQFIDRNHWPPDLDPLDYCLWDAIDKTIKGNRVASKKSLIVALKRMKVAHLGPIDERNYLR